VKSPAISPEELRLKKRRRGWFTDQEPDFHDFKAKLLSAQSRNGEVKMAAVYSVLAKYALLDEAGDPVVELTRLIKDDDFGYTSRKAEGAPHNRDERPIWGPRAGLAAGGFGDRLGLNANEDYGGV
jgi:hypothetical protein